MTSIPHRSGLPASQPSSRSGSRRAAFPPPPKSVRTWLVTAADPQEPSTVFAESQPSIDETRSDAKNVKLTSELLLAGILVLCTALAAWLFVFRLK
jgi:hypothetical protein